MPTERNLTSAEIRRKANKPIMEKKRRERINKCLEELKTIVLRELNEVSRPNKLEKADILEMTVRYLRTIHRKVNLKDEKDNILCGRSSSAFQSIVKQDIPKQSTGFSKNELIGYPRRYRRENRDRLKPYYRPHFPMADARALSDSSNLGFLSSRLVSTYLPITSKRDVYPQNTISPTSSVSSKSKCPLPSFNEPESKTLSPYRIALSPAEDPSVTNEREIKTYTAISPDQNKQSWSPDYSDKSYANFPVDSFNGCRKSNGLIWRPWGVAS